MKKIIFAMVVVLTMMAGAAFADTIALKATWTANTDSYTTGYRLYRTDSGRTLVGEITGKTTALYLFNLTVPTGSTGTATFVLVSINATKKESGDSNTASFPFDQTPVGNVPAGLGVSK